jgi:hypothetical protein
MRVRRTPSDRRSVRFLVPNGTCRRLGCTPPSSRNATAIGAVGRSFYRSRPLSAQIGRVHQWTGSAPGLTHPHVMDENRTCNPIRRRHPLSVTQLGDHPVTDLLDVCDRVRPGHADPRAVRPSATSRIFRFSPRGSASGVIAHGCRVFLGRDSASGRFPGIAREALSSPDAVPTLAPCSGCHPPIPRSKTPSLWHLRPHKASPSLVCQHLTQRTASLLQ